MESVKDYLTDFVNRAMGMEENLAGITGILQFDFTEDNNGYWAFELNDGKAEPLIEGKVDDPTMTITGAFKTYYDLKHGKLDPDEVFASGKLVLGKDTTFTLKLRAAGLE